VKCIFALIIVLIIFKYPKYRIRKNCVDMCPWDDRGAIEICLSEKGALTVYLSITDSFFLWGSQRKWLIYTDAIFVSVVEPMSYTLNLLTRFIPTKLMAVTQLPFFPWTDEYRLLESRMTILVFSTNDNSVVCYHTRLVFEGTFEKVVTDPATKFCSRDKPMVGARKLLRNLLLVSFVMKFFSNQSFRCVCKTF